MSDEWEERVARSVGEVPAGEWDALTGGNILASHGWLSAAERGIEGLEPRYVLLHRDGRLVAAAACYRHEPGNAIFSPDGLMFLRLRRMAARLGLSWLPAMSCGPYRSYGAHLLALDALDGARRERTLRRLLDGVERLAGSEGMPLWLHRVSEDEPDIPSLLARRGYHRTRVPPVAYIDIRWGSFDDYLAHLRGISRNMSSAARREINRNRRVGVVIEEIDDPGPLRARIHQLASEHYFRLNRRRVPYDADFLPQLKRSLGDGIVLYGAVREGDLVGFSVLLKRDGVGYLPFVGMDRERARDDLSYFNLTFYRPIADAIATGMKRLYMGTMLYAMKARRGCSIMPLHSFYKGTSAARQLVLRPWFAVHAARADRKHHRLEDVMRRGRRA